MLSKCWWCLYWWFNWGIFNFFLCFSTVHGNFLEVSYKKNKTILLSCPQSEIHSEEWGLKRTGKWKQAVYRLTWKLIFIFSFNSSKNFHIFLKYIFVKYVFISVFFSYSRSRKWRFHFSPPYCIPWLATGSAFQNWKVFILKRLTSISWRLHLTCFPVAEVLKF